MNALVVTSSVVVEKLLSLTFEKNGIESEIVDNLDKASSNDYSVILVDDIIENAGNVINEIKNEFDYNKLVLIGNNEELAKECDLILKKPFIANDVESMLEEVDFSDDLIFDDEDDDIAQINEDRDISLKDDNNESEDFIEDEEENEEEDENISELIKNAKETTPKVLDPQEIEKIKALMTLDESEDDVLDEISYIDKIKNKESFKLKTKEAKKFFKELKNIKKKELKRLLKGAKIRVKIEFKQDI